MYRDDKIRAAMGEKRINKSALAKRTGLSRDTVHLIVEGKQSDVKLSSLEAIAKELGMSWFEVFEGLQVA